MSVVRFEHVSKQYALGLTRTSLPSAISSWFKTTIGRLPKLTTDQKSFWALQDVSFEIEQGNSVALIGANGAGKTTILKLLANICRPTSGNIQVDGKLSALIELGAGFHPDLTGRENIFLNGTILGLKRKEIEQRVDEIIAFSDLEHFIDTPVKRYSSGMVVRLGFAVATCIEPDILLVDEVLAVGDTSFRQKCLDRIQALLKRGTSIVFVSHNFWLVQAVCSTALYLEKGQVQYFGNTAEAIALYDRALNLQRARDFASSEPQPFISAESDIEITEVELIKSSGTTGDPRSDEPFEVRVHYRAHRDYEAANCIVRIIRSDGLTCCMMRTSIDKIQFSIPRGTGTISVMLNPLQLYGGSHYIQAVINDVTDSHPLAERSSEWFYVQGSPLSHQEMNGVFEPRRTWHHEVADDRASLKHRAGFAIHENGKAERG